MGRFQLVLLLRNVGQQFVVVRLVLLHHLLQLLLLYLPDLALRLLLHRWFLELLVAGGGLLLVDVGEHLVRLGSHSPVFVLALLLTDSV